ncbi:MAG: VOC family protein [Pseudomonadales bacterium]
MPQGMLAHIDLSVADPSRSISFYDALLGSLGYQRWRATGDDWQEPNPTRAAWGLRYEDGSSFGIDLRPATVELDRRYNRYAPGPHHSAFQVDSDSEVDRLFALMKNVDAEVLDPPANYGGQSGYGKHYYAAFFADPDGYKIEIVHATNEWL